MVDPTLYLTLAVTVLLLITGTIFLSYWIPKKLGYKKNGIVLSSILTIGLLILILGQFVLKDYLFFKSDAKEFLSNHDISLKDEFKIINNNSDELLDAYQKFNLEISSSDRVRIIELIKASDNFGEEDLNKHADNSTTTVNYEDNNSFVRKSTQTFGPNEVQIIGIIQVDKTKNILTCYEYIP